MGDTADGDNDTSTAAELVAWNRLFPWQKIPSFAPFLSWSRFACGIDFGSRFATESHSSRKMRAWVVKGKPSRNDFAKTLRANRTERWVTRRPPRDWEPGDFVFMWKGAPASCVVGLAEITRVQSRNENGDAFFTLRYSTDPLDRPIGIEQLRADDIVGPASFLKPGAAGTVFVVTEAQALRMLQLIQKTNHVVIGGGTVEVNVDTSPEIALSIRQPWAELIMRGIKTIEARALQTHKRARVQVYAGKNRASAEDEARVTREYGLDIDALPRGVIVGTVEIIDCKPLRPSDSAAAAFPIIEGDESFGWHLVRPVRARILVKPDRHPQPMFFRPFD